MGNCLAQTFSFHGEHFLGEFYGSSIMYLIRSMLNPFILLIGVYIYIKQKILETNRETLRSQNLDQKKFSEFKMNDLDLLDYVDST